MGRLTGRASRFAFHISRVNWFWAAALLLAVAAAFPLLAQPGLLNTRGGGDSPFLLQRLQQLETAVRAGHFPVRWMPDANYGYGYPFYNYYAPLSIYIAAIFRLLGFSYVRAIQLSQLAAFLTAAAGMFQLARCWWRDEWAALSTAVAYTVAPFHMVNVYVRGDSLAEFWAMAFYPWVILAADALIRQQQSRRRRQVALFALVYAALILSHNISALIFSPFLLLYMLLKAYFEFRAPPSTLGTQRSSLYMLLFPFASLLLAFALAAWFFVPALWEKNLAQLGPATAGFFHFSNHFRGGNLVQWCLLFDYNPDGGTAFRMGLVQAGTAVLGLVGFLLQRRRGTKDTQHLLFVILTLFIATIMITPLSRWLWEHLPLLAFTQFPWRFLSVQAFATALAAGGIAWLLSPVQSVMLALPWRRWLVLGIIALLFLSGLGRLRPDHLLLTDADVTAEKLAQYEWFTGNIGTTISAEYLPYTVNPRPVTSPWLESGERDRIQILSGTVKEVQLQQRGAIRQNWQADATTPATLVFPTLYWPGWAAEIDGVAVAIRPSLGSGLITLDVPAGMHGITLRLTRPPVRLWAELLSLLALLITLWLLRPVRFPRPDRSTLTTIALALFALSLLILTIHLWPHFNRPNTDLTWDFAQAGYLHHDEAGVLFQDGTRLMQYTYTQDVVTPGQTLQITLDTTNPQDETATLALVTPAVYRVDTAPVLVSQTQPLTPHTIFTLAVPANAPAGLYVPRLTVTGTYPLLPSGQPRGDLFLRPLRIMVETGTTIPPERPLDVRLTELSDQADGWLLKLVWFTRRPLTPNYNVSLRLLDASGQVVTQFDTQPGYGFHPSSSWAVGQWVDDWLTLPRPDDLPDTGALMVQLYEIGGDIVLNRRLAIWTNGKLRPYKPTFGLADALLDASSNGLVGETAVFSVNDAPFIQLDGYTFTQSHDQLSLILYWEARTVMPTDYTRFIHVLDEQGNLVAQNDAMPQSNSYPTSQWRAGEIVSDAVLFDAANIPAGAYQFVVGFYENLGDDLPRLTAAAPDGSPLPNNAVRLSQLIQIENK